MNILGIDVGNANVNSSNGVVFESRVKPGITTMNENDIKVVYGGVEYTLGTIDGALNIRKNKHKKAAYKLSLLTAIAKSYKTKTINCSVVVGVPVEDFNNKALRADIKEIIEAWGTEKITINDENKTINIEKAEVFCESAIVFSDREKFKTEKTLVIDLGGSTVDVSFWDGLVQLDSRTYKEGMISLYETIAKALNNKFESKLESHMVKNCIGKNEFEINQDVKDIKFIDIIVENYIDGLTSYINQYFSIDAANSIQVIGGGAIQLFDKIKEEYESAVLVEDAAFANANTYKKIGDVIWI